VDATVNIHDPLTALLCFGKNPKVDSYNYTINTNWLSKQQATQTCNLGGKHQSYLAAMQYKIEKISWARHSSLYFFTTLTTQNTLNKWKFDLYLYN